MGAKKPPKVKEFLIKHKFDVPDTFKIEHNAVYMMDWDIAFNGAFYSTRTGEYESLFKKMHAGILEDIRHHNEVNFVEGRCIRQIMLLSTFLEEKSKFLDYKAKTHEKRAEGGMTKEQIEARGDFATWTYISDADEKLVHKTRQYKYWMMNRVLALLYEEFEKAIRSGVLTREMEIDAVHFIGYQGKQWCLFYSEEDTQFRLTVNELTGAGEADVHLRAIDHFDYMLKNFAIICKTTDTDIFPVALNLPKEWKFECGFYVNTGIQFKKSKTRPENVYLWIDLKAAQNSDVDWKLFGLSFVLLGTDYSETVSWLDFDDIDKTMERLKDTSFTELMQQITVKRQKTDVDFFSPAAAEWNLRYWGIDYS